jgi:hypothetical protein
MEPYQPKEQSMNRTTILKSLAAATLALGTLAAATTAHARTNVDFSVTVGTPVYVQPRQGYAHHRSVYVQPAPIYVHRRPAYAQPAPAYGWGHQRHYEHGRNMYAYGPRGDFDHDGIPNRYDRFPRNPNWR